MIKKNNKFDFNKLVKLYFSDETQTISLKKGEILITEGGFNDRLFLVKQGLLIGYNADPEKNIYEVFRAEPDMLVGVYSYFSKTFSSVATVIARENSEVVFIDQTQKIAENSNAYSLAEEFMPVVVNELIYRQELMSKVSKEKENAIKKLMQSEKLVSLGQMAAGIAHELNNSTAVLKRNTEWIKDELLDLWKVYRPEEYKVFKKGITDGRNISSTEIRKKIKKLCKEFNLGKDDANYLSQMEFPEEKIREIINGNKIKELFSFWEMGATINDMLNATSHSTHVLSSVKSLGAEQPERKTDVNFNDVIKESLSLLHNDLKNISVISKLNELPLIEANKGELVQVITNIVKNAFDSLVSSKTLNPEIEIKSSLLKKSIIIDIKDNGSGIPENLLPKIFEPKFTTKSNSSSFGLGLGLAIVQRIIHSYSGEVTVKSLNGETIFKIKIPVGEINAES